MSEEEKFILMEYMLEEMKPIRKSLESFDEFKSAGFKYISENDELGVSMELFGRTMCLFVCVLGLLYKKLGEEKELQNLKKIYDLITKKFDLSVH